VNSDEKVAVVVHIFHVVANVGDLDVTVVTTQDAQLARSDQHVPRV